MARQGGLPPGQSVPWPERQDSGRATSLGADVDPWNYSFRTQTTKVGFPEGCPFSPTLANLYLAELDRRWQPRGMVRVGDNFACGDLERLLNDLLQIGLVAKRTDQFTRSRPQSGGPDRRNARQ